VLILPARTNPHRQGQLNPGQSRLVEGILKGRRRVSVRGWNEATRGLAALVGWGCGYLSDADRPLALNDQPTLPPPGWYPETGNEGFQRFWSGSDWIGESHPIAPPASGPAPVPATPEPVVVAPPVTVSRPSQCPVCLMDDQVQQVGVVLDAGSSATRGTAKTDTLSVSTRGGLGYSASSTNFSATTMSGLAQRLAAPRRPGGLNGCLGVVIWVVAYFAVAALAQRQAGAGWGWGFWLSIVAATVVVIGVAGRVSKTREPKRRRWDACNADLRDGYFCLRDGIAFRPGATNGLAPERFVSERFAPFRHDDAS